MENIVLPGGFTVTALEKPEQFRIILNCSRNLSRSIGKLSKKDLIHMEIILNPS